MGVFHVVRKVDKRENGEMTIESYKGIDCAGVEVRTD